MARSKKEADGFPYLNSCSAYQVVLIGGCLEFLVDPALGLVTVSLEGLELVRLLKHVTSHRGCLVQAVPPGQQLEIEKSQRCQ